MQQKKCSLGSAILQEGLSVRQVTYAEPGRERVCLFGGSKWTIAKRLPGQNFRNKPTMSRVAFLWLPSRPLMQERSVRFEVPAGVALPTDSG